MRAFGIVLRPFWPNRVEDVSKLLALALGHAAMQNASIGRCLVSLSCVILIIDSYDFITNLNPYIQVNTSVCQRSRSLIFTVINVQISL